MTICVECATGRCDACELRQEIVGPERALAVAIYGEQVTACCCSSWDE